MRVGPLLEIQGWLLGGGEVLNFEGLDAEGGVIEVDE